MSVLTGPEIHRLVNVGRGFKLHGDDPPLPRLSIEPFDPKLCGPNSYDVHLGDKLKLYVVQSAAKSHPELFREYSNLYAPTAAEFNDLPYGIDCARKSDTITTVIPKEGAWLHPGVLYLGTTMERTSCEGIVPYIDGRSSIGRCGLFVHVTAGRGDDAWGADTETGKRWTLEIMCPAHPVKVYPGMRLAQLTFLTLTGDRSPYHGRYGADDDGMPVETRIWQDFQKDGVK